MNLDEMYISLPGRIVEYFPEDQTATIQICVERLSSSTDESNGKVKRNALVDVPVHTPSGGGWSVTMPITTGNTCMLFFSQQGYDHWLFDDKDEAGLFKSKPMTWLSRKFDMQDCYAIVGLNTLPRAVKNYSATHSQWRDLEGTQVISLNLDETITIDSVSEVTITAPIVNILSSTEINLTTPTINCSGDLNVSGSIESVGDITADGVSMLTHVHRHIGDGVDGEVAH